MNAANADRHRLEATGIATCVCGRHGCVCPLAVCDFQKGERQMNIDYALAGALSHNMDDIKRVVLLYDINCQYSVHLKERFDASDFIELPGGLVFIPGIGLFHVHGHQEKCFIRFSPSFIEGVGLVDGEVVETLWAVLNRIFGSTRGMTTSHRHEVINRHMNDYNWKKMINMGEPAHVMSQPGG